MPLPAPRQGRFHVNVAAKLRPGMRVALDRSFAGLYLIGMKPIFDMDDRARLPWRFYGATMAVLARP